MLGEAMSSLLTPLRRAAESGFEILLGSEETRKCNLIMTRYCCDISEAKDLTAPAHGAGTQHPCVTSHSRYEDTMMSSRSSSGVVAEALEMQREVKELQGAAGSLPRSGHSRKQREMWDEIDPSIYVEALVEWLSLLEKMCGGDGVVVKDLYLILKL